MPITAPTQLAQVLHARRDVITDHWYRAIAQTDFTPFESAQVRQRLNDLTEQVITLLLAEDLHRDAARSIGAALARLYYFGPRVLARTQETLAQQITAELSADQIAMLYPRLTALLAEVASGFCMLARETILTERGCGEETVRESEERYRNLFERMPVGIYRTTAAGQILDANPALVQILGYPDRESLLAINVIDGYVDPQDREQWQALMEQEGVVREFETCWRRYDGTVIWARDSARTIRDADRRVLYYEGAVEDITEHKRVETELHTALEKYRVLFESFPLGISVTDATGNIIETNRESERLLGVPRDEHSQRKCDGPEWRIVRLDGTPMPPDEYASVRAFREKRLVENVEMGVVKGGREITWISVTAAPISLEGYGVAIAYGDITERKRAEESLQKSESLLLAIEKMARVGGWEFDVATLKTVWTEEVYEIYDVGLDYEPTVSKGIDFYAPEAKPIIAQAVQRAIDYGEPFDLELPFITAKGNRLWVHAIGQAQRSDGKTTKVFGTFQDITERKRAEEEIRKLNRSLERRTTELVALNKAGQALTSTLNLESVLRLVLAEARNLLDSEGASMLLYEPASDELVFAAADSPGSEKMVGTRMPATAGIAGWVMRQRQAALVGDTQNDTRFYAGIDALTGMTTRSLLAVPLTFRGAVTGVLEAVNQVSGAFTRHDLEMLTTLAGSAAIAIENARLYEDVHAGHEQLRILSARLMEAQEAERRSLARELHDEIGQVLTAVKTNLQAIQLVPDPLTLVPRLEESIGIVDRALKQVRDLSLDLRPSLLDDFGLVPALEWYVEHQALRSGFAAEFIAEPPEMRLSPTLETACFRVAQAALTNVAQHTRAKRVRVELRRRPVPNAESGDETELELVIRDDGVGFDVQAALARAARGASLGLLAMQERVRLVGGQIEIESAPAHGTQIRARFPITW